ncbi:MAG: sodium transporter, partial [Pseudomonadales bacterium]
MLNTLDYTVLGIYVVALFLIAQLVSREKDQHKKTGTDYFLAGKALPWWAVGASLIAANISAEQIIGMSGSGYAIGLAIASYEWMAALTLIIVGKFILPVFLARGINTMPEYLAQRFSPAVKNTMAVFWLGVYVFVNLTSILWLGSLAISTVTGLGTVHGMLFLGTFALAYSLYGGLRAVAMTDIIQVVLLVGGGLMIAYVLLNELSGQQGVLAGFRELTARAPEKFDMILSPDNPHYISLPGLSVLLGGMWIMNLSYWGFNQYIVQRALGAKDLREAQKGIVFAAFLKVLMPIIVVLPGIAIYALNHDLASPDQAYPTALTLLPAGLKGLVFAALIAAIVSSLASMVNSISTIFILDIVPLFRRGEPAVHMVGWGRVVSCTAMLLALLVAKPLLGNFDQAFQYIQEFTGFFTPGICAIFLLGIFWQRTTSAGAFAAAILSGALSLLLKLAWPELPFIDRVGFVFVLCVVAAVLLSIMGAQRSAQREPAVTSSQAVSFQTTTSYNVAAIAVIVVLSALYL